MTEERSADEIRRDIEARRDSITDTVDKLGDRLHETLDWRHHVAQRPYAALGAAAAVGLFIARMIGNKVAERRQLHEGAGAHHHDLDHPHHPAAPGPDLF